MNEFWGHDADPTAQGRIQGAKPVAVLDIGSNSVRLVVYERHARSLTPLYNEKSACSLGRGLAQSGRLAYENIDRALTAIQRFALVTRLMKAGDVYVLATSAVRDASNSKAFVDAVEATMNAHVSVLSGEEEAHYAAVVMSRWNRVTEQHAAILGAASQVKGLDTATSEQTMERLSAEFREAANRHSVPEEERVFLEAEETVKSLLTRVMAARPDDCELRTRIATALAGEAP